MELEEQNFGEQPKVEPSLEDNDFGSSTGETDINKVEFDDSKAERGVPIGKFKDVEDLYQAYTNLQSEFTRKCQKLSELEKDKTAILISNEEKFENDFKVFLSKNQEAFLYADEIKSKVLQDESLKNQENAFEKVWTGMIYEKLSKPNRTKEPLVRDMILKDDELKNLIIENYVKQLQEQKTPIVMSSSSGERVTKTVTPKPDSFEKAKKVVLDLLS